MSTAYAHIMAVVIIGALVSYYGFGYRGEEAKSVREERRLGAAFAAWIAVGLVIAMVEAHNTMAATVWGIVVALQLRIVLLGGKGDG